MQTKSRQIKLSLIVTVLFACMIAGVFGTKQVNAASDSFEITSDGVLTAYTGTAAEVVIPSNVKVIGNKAFYNNGHLTKVTIPDSVVTIEYSAFEGCSNLSSVRMVEGLLAIEDRVFARCSKLTEVTVPSSVAALGAEAFYNCKSLKTVNLPDNLTNLKSGLFLGCASLKEVTLPKQCYHIEDGVFEGCRSLRKIVFNENLASIGKAAFKNCESLTSVTLPAKLEVLGQEMFFNCKSLTGVNLPSTLTAIESYSFYGCSSLKEITIPAKVTSIGEEAFANCSTIKNIALPGKLTVIENKTFNNCTSLMSVSIPEGMKTIKDSAFRNCTSLQAISLPASLTSFEARAVEGCRSLSRIEVAAGNAAYQEINGSIYTKDGKTLVKGIAVNGTFTVPSKVQIIGPRAFYNEDTLTSIQLGNVATIMEYAFYDCDGLGSITLPNTLSKIGGRAFQGLSKLYRIEVQDGSSSYVMLDGILYGENKTEGGRSVVLVSRSKGGTITIPATVNGEAVTAVESGAFSECSAVTRIVLPDSVARIESAAFTNCKNLTYVNIPEGVAAINNDTFSGCSKLASITLPASLTAIKSGAFSGCSALEGITIPAAVTAVYPDSFEGCESLGNIQVEAGNTRLEVENQILYRTTDSGKILIRGSVNAEGTILVPDDVTEIGYHSLADCMKVTSVTVKGEHVTKIKDPFDGLASLKTFAVFSEVSEEFSVVLDAKTSLFASSKSALVSQYAASLSNDFYVLEEGEKVMTNYALPTGLQAVYMQTLAEVQLPEGYRFAAADTTSVGPIGTNKVELLYTPEDTMYLTEAALTADLKVIPRTFAITYELNGGTNSSKNPAEYKEMTAMTLAVPVKSGYIFEGWYTDAACTSLFNGFTNKTTGDVVLYAKWGITSFKITYALNGGQVTGNPATYQFTTATITLKNPTKKGYTFDGWYNGTKKVTQIVKGSAGNLTLTAKWKLTPYSIKYNVAGGNLAKGSQTSFTMTTNTFSLKNPTRKGYTFAGWYNGTKKVTKIAKGTTGNVSLTAKWTKVSVAKSKITSAKNNKAKTITINVKKQSDVAGYVYEFSTDKKFKSGVKTATSKSNVCSLNKFTKGKTYYVRVYTYKLDSAGNKVLGARSTAVKVAVKK